MNYNIYKEYGFENRQAYLQSLAEDYNLDITTVTMFANFLGKGEDFDGLITMLEDHEEMMEKEFSDFDEG